MDAEELRKDLQSYGVSTGPITPTTMPVYMRKLNTLRNQSRAIRVKQDSRRSSAHTSTAGGSPPLNNFSSDESDEDDGHLPTSNASRNSRLTPSRQQRSPTSATSENQQPNVSAHEQLSLIRRTFRPLNGGDLIEANRRHYLNAGYHETGNSVNSLGDQTLKMADETRNIGASTKTAIGQFMEMYHSWQVVSGFVVLLVLSCVTAIIISYCFITSSSPPSFDTRSEYKLCTGEPAAGSEMSGCVPQSELGTVQIMIRELLDALSTRAGEYDCGYRSDTRRLSRVEVQQLLDEHQPSNSVRKGSDYLPLIYELCSSNEHWNIIVHKDSELESAVAKKSLWCRVSASARNIFNAVILLALVVVSGCGLVVFVRMRQNAAEVERQEVFELVEKIIDMLCQNAEAAEASANDPDARTIPPYLAIPHVRDALIPLQQRRAKQRIWDQAVAFLSSNESRVRVENQKIAGEEFSVWRWIQPVTDGVKVWQGQAFGGSQSGFQSQSRSYASVPQKPLTTCLKIRNMFDAAAETGEDWHQTVQDAVLDKCSEASIVHIAVDSDSTDGCVYVRCNDLKSAGIAFRALHGWWFDGRLVTVKYLREQRYEEHYPESHGVTSPVRPSNNSQLSLSRPYYSSIIENT